jgi:hypothetical protein
MCTWHTVAPTGHIRYHHIPLDIYPKSHLTQAGGESTNSPFNTVTTSYDFDAPIDEGGELMPKFFALRQTFERLTGERNPYPIPSTPPKKYYGRVKMRYF